MLQTMPPEKLLVIFLFTFVSLSLIRLLIVTSNSSQSPILPDGSSLTSSRITRHSPNTSENLRQNSHTISEEDILSPKEYQLLSNLISSRAPCNILFFGFKPQFLGLATVNSNGTTVFLEDDVHKLSAQKVRGMRVSLVDGHEKAEKAYELLEHARKSPACKLHAGHLQGSKCRLALRGLPNVVYQKKWDVVVVDGPRGDSPEAPGRMGAIYVAAMVARVGSRTDVFVHNTDRMIEKWYSWEFLCHENLIASKGRLWHFRIGKNSSSGTFCPENKSMIL